MGQAQEKLQWAFQTNNPVFILASTGTGPMEAAIVNTLSPGDEILVASNGIVANRFANIASAFGARVTRIDSPWDSGIRPSDVSQALKDNSNIKALLVVHNETKTGVTNPLEEIVQVARDHGALTLVDGISSIGAIDLPTDRWGIDVAITSCNKAFGVPPGMAMISMSEAARKASEGATMPRYYFDLTRAARALEQSRTSFSSPTNHIRALNEALSLMQQEGLPNIFERHRVLAEMVRSGVKEMGLELYAHPEFASNTVTAIKTPLGMDTADIIDGMRGSGIELPQKEGEALERIFRIGHMGFKDPADIERTLDALQRVIWRR